MKIIPLKQWICDSCGKIIKKPKDGWYEWYSDNKTALHTGFRIVHHRPNCMYDDKALHQQNRSEHSLPLSYVVGSAGRSAGLGYFLFSIVLAEKKEVYKLADIEEYIEIIRRLYLPYWEEARLYWDNALKYGFHDGCDFSEDMLLSIIMKYRES
ncbi:hypothetical protein ES703_120192 [subsurface metagenome]